MEHIKEIIGPWIIGDIVLILIILIKLAQGRKQGVIKKLGKFVALLCGVVGGRLIRDRFAEAAAVKFVEPIVVRLLDKVKATLGIGAISENLGLGELSDGIQQILENVKLPPFLTSSVADEAMKSFGTKASGAIDAAVSAAAHTIALRLSALLLFVLSSLVIFIIVKLLFDGLLDSVIRKLPVIRSVNSLLGAVIGALEGVIIAGLVLLAAYKLAPQLSQKPEAWLSPASVSRTYVVKAYFNTFPGVFS